MISGGQSTEKTKERCSSIDTVQYGGMKRDARAAVGDRNGERFKGEADREMPISLNLKYGYEYLV